MGYYKLASQTPHLSPFTFQFSLFTFQLKNVPTDSYTAGRGDAV